MLTANESYELTKAAKIKTATELVSPLLNEINERIKLACDAGEFKLLDIFTNHGVLTEKEIRSVISLLQLDGYTIKERKFIDIGKSDVTEFDLSYDISWNNPPIKRR